MKLLQENGKGGEKDKMNEAEIFNRIEKKAKKGKATDRELRLLAEAYSMHGIKIPREILKQMGG